MADEWNSTIGKIRVFGFVLPKLSSLGFPANEQASSKSRIANLSRERARPFVMVQAQHAFHFLQHNCCELLWATERRLFHLSQWSDLRAADAIVLQQSASRRDRQVNSSSAAPTVLAVTKLMTL
jgi:hypothetical protein